MFFRRSGPAVDLLARLQVAPAFRRAKFETRARSRHRLRRLISGIGQVHPVGQGRFDFFLARKIGSVQSWLFSACRFLSRAHGVRSFGQEGFSTNRPGQTRARVSEPVLAEIRHIVDDHREVRSYLLKTAQRWKKAVHKKNRKQITETVTALNALTLMQALDDSISMFPIEQKDVHGRIHDGITQLHQQIEQVKSTSLYQSFHAKEGKNLTKQEYELATELNDLVDAYSKLLKHPERDRSIFREVVEHAEEQDMTVFILGNAHRSQILRLARKHVPSDALFVWVTPPALWWWEAMLRRTGWILAGVIVLYVFFMLVG